MSISTVPGRTPSNTPFGPASTSSTSGESGTIVMTTVASRATSAGLPATCAPARASVSTGPRLRLCTTSVWPALIRLSAIGRPIRPRPMKPTVSRSGIA